MPPEFIIAAVSASCAVLLVVGGVVVGQATADMAQRKKRAESLAAEERMKARLQEALTQADAARAEIEAMKLDSSSHEARDQDDEASEKAKLESLLAETQAKLKKAEAATNEADKEFSIVRDRLDNTEKRLADANRLVAEHAETKESPSTVDSDKLEALEKELAEAKRAAVRLEVVEKERDHALRRIRELDKKPSAEARIQTLQKQLQAADATVTKLEAQSKTDGKSKDASGEAETLRKELEAANERVTVSERVMEGVRARSNMLSQELKKVKAELAELKASKG